MADRHQCHNRPTLLAEHGRIGTNTFRGGLASDDAGSRYSARPFFACKGQALIWAANLLHGGSVQHDPARTRWSQVTHYYFRDCIYYTPAFSVSAPKLM
jgi:hypothetical protein